MLEPLASVPLTRRDERRFVVPSLGRPYAPVMAANYRAFGLDAVAPPPSDAEGLRAARRDCSGKECLPYQLIWSGFRDEIDRRGDAVDHVLVEVTSQGTRRNCMFSVKDQVSLEHLGLAERVTMRDTARYARAPWTS